MVQQSQSCTFLIHVFYWQWDTKNTDNGTNQKNAEYRLWQLAEQIIGLFLQDSLKSCHYLTNKLTSIGYSCQWHDFVNEVLILIEINFTYHFKS